MMRMLWKLSISLLFTLGWELNCVAVYALTTVIDNAHLFPPVGRAGPLENVFDIICAVLWLAGPPMAVALFLRRSA